MPAAAQQTLTWKFWLTLISITVLGWLFIIASAMWPARFRAHPRVLLGLVLIGLLCMFVPLARAAYLRLAANRLPTTPLEK
jgi:amino acid transporter